MKCADCEHYKNNKCEMFPDNQIAITNVNAEHECGFFFREQSKERTIYKRALNLWGEPAQIKMAVEECAELIIKLMKVDRFKNGCEISDVCEEIADVEIMMSQMRLVFGSDAVEDWKKRKLARLLERVGYGEGHA